MTTKTKHKAIEKRINHSVNGIRRDCLTLYNEQAWKEYDMTAKEYAEQRLHALGYSMFKKHVNAALVEDTLQLKIGTYSLRSMLPLYPYINSENLADIWTACLKMSRGKKVTEKIVTTAINQHINRDNVQDEEVEELLAARANQQQAEATEVGVTKPEPIANNNKTEPTSPKLDIEESIPQSPKGKLSRNKELQLKFLSEIRQYDETTNFKQYLLLLMREYFDKKTLYTFSKKLSAKKG